MTEPHMIVNYIHYVFAFEINHVVLRLFIKYWFILLKRVCNFCYKVRM